MGSSWRLGRAFGIDVYVHWSFLLIPALVLYGNLDSGLTVALAGVGLVLALFGCVVLHELGHALMARSFHIGTRDITLYPIGGIARLERMPERPLAEILIAIAGPLVNLVIAGGLWLGLVLSGRELSLNLLSHNLVIQLLAANVGLLVFNMLPAFPMDGGRVLRAGLSFFMNRVRATEVAVGVSRVLSLGFLILAFTQWGSLILAFIAVFVFLAGSQELAAVRMREAWRGAGFEPDAPLPRQPYVQAGGAVAPGWSGFTWDPRTGVWVQWHNGEPVGASSFGGQPDSR
jgi:Zn-dependent protease